MNFFFFCIINLSNRYKIVVPVYFIIITLEVLLSDVTQTYDVTYKRKSTRT